MIYDFFHIILACLLFEVVLFDLLRIDWDEKIYKFTFNVTWIILALIAAFRYGVGSDTVNYMVAYSYIPTLSELDVTDFVRFRFSPLYIIVNSLCRTVTDSYLLLQILQTSVFFGGTYYLLKYYNIRKLYIILFFYLFLFFIEGLSAMRESMAMGVCFFSMKFYEEEKWVKFGVLTFLAFMLHSGALIFAILPVVKYVSRKGNRGIIALIAATVILFVVGSKYVEGIQELFSFGDNSLGRYINKEEDEPTAISITNVVRNLALIGILIKYLFADKENVKFDFVLLAIIYSAIDVVSGKFPMAIRLASYFQFALFYALVMVVERWSKHPAIRVAIIVIFFYQPFARYLFLFDDYGYDPYCSYFSSDKSYYENVLKTSVASDYVLF